MSRYEIIDRDTRSKLGTISAADGCEARKQWRRSHPNAPLHLYPRLLDSLYDGERGDCILCAAYGPRDDSGRGYDCGCAHEH